MLRNVVVLVLPNANNQYFQQLPCREVFENWFGIHQQTDRLPDIFDEVYTIGAKGVVQVNEGLGVAVVGFLLEQLAHLPVDIYGQQ